MTTQRKLTRNTQSGMVCGVCSGLAEYLDIDVALVRLGFVALVLTNGIGIVAYLAMCMVIPEKRAVAQSGPAADHPNGSQPKPVQFEALGSRDE